MPGAFVDEEGAAAKLPLSGIQRRERAGK